jgi:flagellar basal body rod protein FlgB
MYDIGFGLVEQGLRMAQQRAIVLAGDAANARTPGFVARDLSPVVEASAEGFQFAAAMHDAPSTGEGGTIEYAMGATAANSIRFRALADQEHAMLREFRTVAEDARR